MPISTFEGWDSDACSGWCCISVCCLFRCLVAQDIAVCIAVLFLILLNSLSSTSYSPPLESLGRCSLSLRDDESKELGEASFSHTILSSTSGSPPWEGLGEVPLGLRETPFLFFSFVVICSCSSSLFLEKLTSWLSSGSFVNLSKLLFDFSLFAEQLLKNCCKYGLKSNLLLLSIWNSGGKSLMIYRIVFWLLWQACAISDII